MSYRDLDKYEKRDALISLSRSQFPSRNPYVGFCPTNSSRIDREHKGLGDSLCTTCDKATVFRREGIARIHVRCSQVGYVPPDISECSMYLPRNYLTEDTLALLGIPIDPREPPPSQKNGYI